MGLGGLGLYRKVFPKTEEKLPEGKLTELKTSFEIPSDIQTWKHNTSVNRDTLRQIIMINPKTVVDVGAGDGFYCKLIKRFIPNCQVTAIEKNKIYPEKFNLASIYDSVINDDIVTAIKNLSGDLIIFGDILEHLEKKDMLQVLGDSLKHFSYVIVNSPLGFQPQEHEFPEERHRCGIEYSDFENRKVLEFRVFDGNMFNCLLIGKQK